MHKLNLIKGGQGSIQDFTGSDPASIVKHEIEQTAHRRNKVYEVSYILRMYGLSEQEHEAESNPR